MLSDEYFEGQKNISKGNRRGDEKLLSELLNQKSSVFVSSEQTGTGAEQDVAHTLVDEAGVAKLPVAVFPTCTDDNGGAVTFAEGTHTTAVLKVTAPVGLKFKLLAL